MRRRASCLVFEFEQPLRFGNGQWRRACAPKALAVATPELQRPCDALGGGQLRKFAILFFPQVVRDTPHALKGYRTLKTGTAPRSETGGVSSLLDCDSAPYLCFAEPWKGPYAS